MVENIVVFLRKAIDWGLIVLLTHNLVSAQESKPIIDSTAIRNWPSLESNVSINNDGKYCSYVVNNQPVGYNTLVVQSTSKFWKKSFRDGSPVCFTKDNERFVFQSKDSLVFVSLGSDEIKYITDIKNHAQPSIKRGEWLGWQMENQELDLLLLNLITGKEKKYTNVLAYTFDKSGNTLLLKTQNKTARDTVTTLQKVDLITGKSIDVWSDNGDPVHNGYLASYTIDDKGNQISFVIQENSKTNSLWYYHKTMTNAEKKFSDKSSQITEGLSISPGMHWFSESGRYLWFTLKEISPEVKPSRSMSKVDVWSYRDTILQSTQLLAETPNLYQCVINLQDNQLVKIQKNHDVIITNSPNADFVVLQNNVAGDRFWRSEYSANSMNSYWLVNMTDGSREEIKTKGFTFFYFSPGGRYLLFWDARGVRSFYAKELSTGEVIDICANAPSDILSYKSAFYHGDTTGTVSSPVGIAGWLENDQAVLVYDNYDIWQLDLSGIKSPRNITNGFGRRHCMRFNVINGDELPGQMVFKKTESLLLSAFKPKTKTNGFYRKFINKPGDPQLLTMDSCFYYASGLQATAADHPFGNWMVPLKASCSKTWIVKKETATEAPNFFVTKDFIQYRQLTHLEPQKKYNWVTSELINWQLPGGDTAHAIIYKPENFDPHKKFPVIFHYYQQMSDKLHQFPIPNFARNNLEIAWFVSRGYIVITPDLHFSHNEPSGQGVAESIVSLVKKLIEIPYIDVKHMAINGHSTAGFFTNYLVANTNLFAAAIEGAGSSDWVSSSLQMSGDRGLPYFSRLAAYENSIGHTLWERQDLYIENSPILKADKIITPLIIFHCKSDGAVPWAQAVEMYISLRRLEKPCWMLQYDDGTHGVWGENAKDAIDYTKRITQFFDHYLKGAPPPLWMTKGIPARLKGIEDGLALDPEGNCSDSCKVCKEKNYKDWKPIPF